MKNIPTPDTLTLFGTPIAQIPKDMSEQAVTGVSALAAQWLNPTTKDLMKQRLRAASKNWEEVDTNDEAVAKEYFRSWLEVPMSSPLQRLIRHPLLTNADKQYIDKYVIDQQQTQIKTGAILTGVTATIYWLLLSKMTFFQNTFNNKERRRVFNIGRKTVALYFVFFGWMMVLNSHYEKKIPNGLNQTGIFKRYRIPFEEKFV